MACDRLLYNFNWNRVVERWKTICHNITIFNLNFIINLNISYLNFITVFISYFSISLGHNLTSPITSSLKRISLSPISTTLPVALASTSVVSSVAVSSLLAEVVVSVLSSVTVVVSVDSSVELSSVSSENYNTVVCIIYSIS